MNEHFRPYRRSLVWLGEPGDAAAYREESTRIAERLQGLNALEWFDVAADEREADRSRWQATFTLTRDDS